MKKLTKIIENRLNTNLLKNQNYAEINLKKSLRSLLMAPNHLPHRDKTEATVHDPKLISLENPLIFGTPLTTNHDSINVSTFGRSRRGLAFQV